MAQEYAAFPMQQGLCVTKCFDPIYSSTLPLDWEDLSSAIDEMNKVFNNAFPVWMKMLPFGMVFTGFFTFAVGGFSHSFGVAGFGMVLFVAGGFGMVVGLSFAGNRALSELRATLSSINAKFASKGVEFQLHESSHLELFHRSGSGGNMGGTGVRTVTTYTLVVHKIGTIPAPHVLAEQALAPPPASAYGTMA
mmetsp:Transcript_50309/g.79685  ORF Transcript_50309/g.79685 Transcript_50309/m.79685 type:complete len:193 (+) Transcript_50309:104-682(+)